MTKYISTFIILLLLSVAAAARDNKADTIPVILHDDYSNRKPANMSVIHSINEQMVQSTVIIIDDRIYSIEDKHYKELDKSKIKNLRVIKDENSQTPIKYVIIIATKQD